MLAKRTACSIVPVALFLFAVIVVSIHGSRTRTYASGESSYLIHAPEQAYAIWKSSNVKGRVLVLFDRYPHAWQTAFDGTPRRTHPEGFVEYDGMPGLTPTNMIEFSASRDMLRKIYLVVPDSEWEQFRQMKTLRPLRNAGEMERGMYLYSFTGIPIIATTPTSLPNISERVLVYINKPVFDEAEARETLERKNIESDIIVVRNGSS